MMDYDISFLNRLQGSSFCDMECTVDGGTFLNLLLFLPLSWSHQWPNTPIVLTLTSPSRSSLFRRPQGSQFCSHRAPYTRCKFGEARADGQSLSVNHTSWAGEVNTGA